MVRMSIMKINRKIILIGVLLLCSAVGYYALSPLRQTVTLSEEVPTESMVVVSPTAISDTPAHPASGVVSVLKMGETYTLRYENFKTINGPDLRVYLSTDLKATEFIDLGKLKATEGNVNYTIPPGTDLARYRYALVWCEDFGVLFNSADLQP